MSDNKIKIFDTTLRDGEQSPGCSMNLEEKLKIFEILEDLNVDVVEAGFARASDGDFEAVKEVAKLAKNTIVCSLARANKEDIERANDALSFADQIVKCFNSPELIKNIGSSAIKLVNSHYDNISIASSLVNSYHELLGEQKSKFINHNPHS